MIYYIGIQTKEKMNIEIITNAHNAQEALQNVINRYPNGIVTFIYKE